MNESKRLNVLLRDFRAIDVLGNEHRCCQTRLRDLEEPRLVAGLPARLLVGDGHARYRRLGDQAQPEAPGTSSRVEASSAEEELRPAARR